jgi:hypothetical protein
VTFESYVPEKISERRSCHPQTRGPAREIGRGGTSSEPAPQSALPQSALPQSALPQSALPQTALPQSALPQSALPQHPGRITLPPIPM